MFNHSATFFVVLGVYTATILGIVVSGMGRNKTEEEFLTAGRSIGPWVGGAVLAATQISAGTLVGTVGRHYGTGVSWVWVWPGVWVGWFISAVLVGPKLRQFGAVTIPDYLAIRYQSASLRLISASFIIIVYMVLLIAQYQACGVIFQAIFGLPPIYAMGLLVASTLVYTILGGVRTSSYIDLLQIFIVAGGLLIATPILVHYAGGLYSAGNFLSLIDTRLTAGWYSWKQIFGTSVVLGVGVAAAPYEMVRFYSMKDKATVRYAIGVCFIFQALIGGAVLLMGLMTRSIFPSLSSADQASSMMAANVLPPIVGSLFIVALISAIMSNVNSVLLVSSAAISHDIYGRFINQVADERDKLLVSRVAIVILSLIPAWFALQNFSDVQSIVVMALRLIGCFFFVPIIIGLNSRFGSRAGAIAAVCSGVGASLIWETGFSTRYPSIDGAEVGILAATLFYVVVGKFTPRISEQTLSIFFKGDPE